MNTAVVSSKYQVVIPREVRENFGLQVGTTVQMICYGNHIALVPLQPLQNLKGIFAGISTDIDREQAERL